MTAPTGRAGPEAAVAAFLAAAEGRTLTPAERGTLRALRGSASPEQVEQIDELLGRRPAEPTWDEVAAAARYERGATRAARLTTVDTTGKE